ncbi:unnamed protein product [Protopolystoma xenopodis]|uniref:Vacuolar protein sorting-associated protein 54 C-terminal domain-containing protein n=1 Tax=Protopolystoma xenopodis TaxID=117903 RepID=A0A3S5B119_9PLAT|nr:unnamed protein product [Protopolystoma xenopodis]
MFNSKTCHLVLGAGARIVADLTTISARNLALTWRSLELVNRCIPLLQKNFTRFVPTIEPFTSDRSPRGSDPGIDSIELSRQSSLPDRGRRRIQQIPSLLPVAWLYRSDN